MYYAIIENSDYYYILEFPFIVSMENEVYKAIEESLKSCGCSSQLVGVWGRKDYAERWLSFYTIGKHTITI